MAVNHSNAQLVQKKVVRSVSGSGSLKIVLRNLVLGILLGLVFRKAVDLVLFPMVTEAWKSLNSALRRLTLFFIVNTVVLLVLVASGFFSPSRGAQGDPTAVQNEELRAAGKQWKRSDSGRFQNRPNLLEPKPDGKDLSLSLVERTRDQKKQPNLTDHMTSTKAVRSPVEHNNDLINGELDDLNEQIEAFIAKVRRQMKQQERQGIT
ncbi:hypothetical protein O6H91_19G021600 [Diphasiastrum complanatum]|uniref:Uncharacterized protein n=1 Tax=Diphasiastrum complanatum TaxID=34168 RepID=A0ACC2AT96_DIPCM|nr:hypothetical protein O6H91_19G021600 [Diphasiastrum complanatum]